MKGFAYLGVTYLNSIVKTCAVALFSTLISSSVQMLIVGVLVTPIINKTCMFIVISNLFGCFMNFCFISQLQGQNYRGVH